jgi:hypothetical protein
MPRYNANKPVIPEPVSPGRGAFGIEDTAGTEDATVARPVYVDREFLHRIERAMGIMGYPKRRGRNQFIRDALRKFMQDNGV